jgi:hypothetical protein
VILTVPSAEKGRHGRPFFLTDDKMMRFVCVFSFLFVVSVHAVTAAEPRVYRCDNAVYTNQPDASQRCVPLTVGNVTVIEGTRVNSAAQTPTSTTGANAVNASATSSAKVDTQEQKQRDAQAVAVLQAELQKAQSRHADLLKEWNQGEPDRHAIEIKQPAKYQERVAQLRMALQRSEADVMGLQRELNRFNNATLGGKP